MSGGAPGRREPRYLGCRRPDRPRAAEKAGRRGGAGNAEGGHVPGVRAAAMAACAAPSKRGGSHSPSRGCATQGRKVALPPSARGPSWRRGQWPRRGASTRSRARPPGPVTGAAAAAARPRRPLPPLPSCSGIFSSDTAFKMAAPPPGNPFRRPLQQAPSRRHLVPRPSPPADIYIAKIGPGGLRPSPHACSLRLPARPHGRAMPRAGRAVDQRPLHRLPGPRATLPQPAAVRRARVRRGSGRPAPPRA